MKKLIIILLGVLMCLSVWAQTDRKEVRSGNRKFRKGDFPAAELEYRKAVLRDSLALAAGYDLASALYRQGSWDEAGKALDRVNEKAAVSRYGDRHFFNAGDVALQKKDYAAAVKAFRESLLRNPDDMEAKENYTYAKMMLRNRQGGGGDNENEDQNQNQNQNENQDQNQDRNQDQQQQDDRQQQSQQADPKEELSAQQARQMLQAIQAKEKETQDKVNKEKAAALQSRQKEKNW